MGGELFAVHRVALILHVRAAEELDGESNVIPRLTPTILALLM